MSDEKIRLLMVEDDMVDRMAFQRMVKAEGLPYEYTCASSAAAGREALKAGSFDVVISDYNLGDGTAFDVISEVPAGVAIILVTGAGDEGIAVKAMKAGAQDYLIKDQSGNYLKTLPVTVANSVKAKATERQLQQYHVELEKVVEELRRTNEELVQQIAQRERAEEDLRESLETSANIVETIPSGLLTFQYQPPGEIFLVSGNPEAEHLLGIKIKDWAGQELDEIWPNARVQGLTRALLHTLQTGERFKEEAGVYMKGGITRFFRVRAFRIPGELLGLAFEDVTERTKAEMALQEAHEEQERRVEERTADLVTENLELKEDIKRRKRSDDLLVRASRLAAMVQMAKPLTDRLSELLATIAGSTGEALSRVDASAPPDVEPLLQQVLDSSQEAASTITRLGQFARAAAGPAGLQIRNVFSLSDCARKAVEICGLQHNSQAGDDGKNLSLELDLNDNCLVEGAEEDLVQVIVNLAQNAKEALPNGGTIKVRTGTEEDHSVVWVEDNGVGILQHDIVKIFEPFWTSKESHSGLGLKMCFGIVHSHGGTIRVYSLIGRGTKVRVSLPHVSQTQEGPGEAEVSSPSSE
ncbi:MAG: response regulator [Desulfomonile tiedjei]|nr:response regulator [Desulfomonile tiedjei]